MSSVERNRTTEEALLDSRKRLSLALAASRMGVWEWDVRNDRVSWSPECFDIIGLTHPKPSLRSFTEILHPEDRDRVLKAAQQALDGRTTFTAEFRIVTAHGDVRRLFNLGKGDYDETGTPRCLVGTVQDVTDRNDVEERLKESESWFRSLAEQSLAGTYIMQEGAFKYVNQRFAKMFGYRAEEIIERMVPQDLGVPEDRSVTGADSADRQAPAQGEMHCEFRGIKKSGEIMNGELFGSRALFRGRPALVGIVLDSTENKKLEQQLRQAQKMEAVGQLTSGIAHDFNNILSAIIGYATLLQIKMKEDDPARVIAGNILGGADRAATLIRNLLTFSRKQVSDLRPVDLNEVIGKAGKLLYWIIGEDIELRTSLGPGKLMVNADPGQIEQALMNLATNAADAMPQGGVLCIETAVVNRDTRGRAADDWNERSIMLSVTDTGTGMDEKTREKIFEPFFTTKDPGQGTGLGLSMVQGIIDQHGGSIHCTSDPGKGARFNIYLPLLPPAHPCRPEAGTTALVPYGGRLHGTETVLLAEDDKAMLSFVTTTLETFGYRVIEATRGKEAIDLFHRHRDEIRLVVADVIMPGMSGAELQSTFRAAAPDLPILFMSGYPASVVYRKSLLDKDAEILSKPFQPDAFLKKVREMLDVNKAK